MPYFLTQGGKIHYALKGQGRPVLLVHGLGSSGADWAFQVPTLAPHFQLVLPDLRGSGASDKPPGPYRIADFASELWQLLDDLGMADADFVGFSLGGAVALEMFLQRPQARGRLVLINTLASYRIDHWRKWLEARGQQLVTRILGTRRTARLAARRLFPREEQAAMRKRVIDVFGANSKRAYLDSIGALIGWCALDRLTDFKRPTLLLAAEHDFTPLAEKQRYAERLGAQLAIIRGSRHGTPFDAIEATNACLLAFLQDRPLPPAERLCVDPPDRVPRSAPSD